MITAIFNSGYPTKMEVVGGNNRRVPDMDVQDLPFQVMPSGHIRVTGPLANLRTLEASHVNWVSYVP